MKHLLPLLFLLFAPLVPLAATAQESLAADQAVNGDLAAIEEAVAADTRIADRIRSILIELEGYDGVSVIVRSGIVTLSGEVLDSAAIDRLEALVSTIDGVLAIQNEVTETTDLGKRLNPAVERIRRRLEQGVAALPLLAVAVGAALLIWLVGLRVARLQNPWNRIAPNAFIADIYRQLVLLAFVLAGIVIALDILNATALLSTILGAAGIIGLAIGFAVRDTVENFIASIMLSIRQPFHPNDAVEIGGDEGKVIRLTSRATILLSFDGNHIRIPNSTVFKSRIVNYSRNAERRYSFDIMVDADCDLAAARRLIENKVTAMPFTLPVPGTAVWIKDLTPAGAIFTVTGWIDQRETSLARARGETMRLVKLALESAGVALTDATQAVRILPEQPSPAQPAGPAPGAGPAWPVGTDSQDDEALEDMIASERRDGASPDLLRQNAPLE